MRRRLPHLPWKRILLVTGVAAISLVTLAVGFGAWAYSQAKQSNVGTLSFDNELAIPPLAEPTVDADGRKVFDLRFTAGESRLVDDGPSETWGLNGSYLGRPCGPIEVTTCGSTSPTAWTRPRRCTGTACTCPPAWTVVPTR